jgi:hypothetical protein
MISKGIRHIAICLFALTLFTMFVITPVSTYQQEIRNNEQVSTVQGTESSLFSISYNILQETNDTTDTTDTTETTETTETSETSEDEFSGWAPFIDKGLYYPLALLFSFGGIFSVFWLIFFVETSKDRTIRERIIGTTIRLIIMCILTGFAIHFWILFEPI